VIACIHYKYVVKRMGHIELAHQLLTFLVFQWIQVRWDLLFRHEPHVALEEVFIFASYVVTEPGNTQWKENSC